MFSCVFDYINSQSIFLMLFRQLSDVEYNRIADETLESLADTLEELADSPATGAEFDVSFSVSL